MMPGVQKGPGVACVNCDWHLHSLPYVQVGAISAEEEMCTARSWGV